MFVNWDGWEEPVTQRLIFVRANHAKMEAYVQTMTMPTFASVPMGTAAITVNITEKYVIEAHASMAEHVLATQMDTMDIVVSAHQEQQETIVKKTQEMNVHIVLAKMELNVLTELGTSIAIVLRNIEVKIVKPMTNRLLVE